MPQISAIIPARNEEANIARVVESLASQAEVREIIVVNDQSSDKTAEILAGLQARVEILRVIEIAELPGGWVGKNFAVATGARAASGDWLLFVDADTQLLPGATRRALADAEERAASLVSYSPEQVMETAAEQILIPFVYTRLAERFSFERVNDPALPGCRGERAISADSPRCIRCNRRPRGGARASARRRGPGAIGEGQRAKYFLRSRAGNRADADVPDVRRALAGLDEKSVRIDGLLAPGAASVPPAASRTSDTA